MVEVEVLLEEMIRYQEHQLFVTAKRLIPNITAEDLLQPNDYPELESNPHFRYEEGVLSGILSVKAAYLAKRREFNQYKSS
ncbi:MAG: hypothetical protein ACSNEK_08780 [Parachlamydiaceae bacterium]